MQSFRLVRMLVIKKRKKLKIEINKYYNQLISLSLSLRLPHIQYPPPSFSSSSCPQPIIQTAYIILMPFISPSPKDPATKTNKKKNLSWESPPFLWGTSKTPPFSLQKPSTNCNSQPELQQLLCWKTQRNCCWSCQSIPTWFRRCCFLF